MASLVFADEVFREDFTENFTNWQSYPHWSIENESAFTDRKTVLISNNLSLENIENCTLSLDWRQGENETRIGLYNISLDNYEWIADLENSTDWSNFEFYFDHDDFFTEHFNLKIQTEFKTGEFYVDNISLDCHVSLVELGPSSPSSGLGGGFSLPSVNFQTATGGEVDVTFSMLPYERKEDFASLIPSSFFVQYCDKDRYRFCDYAVEESPYEIGDQSNLIFYLLILGGLFLYIKRK